MSFYLIIIGFLIGAVLGVLKRLHRCRKESDYIEKKLYEAEMWSKLNADSLRKKGLECEALKKEVKRLEKVIKVFQGRE